MTEREKVLLRREGAVEYALRHFPGNTRENVERCMALEFPLPKVTRRRVVRVDGYEYRVDASGNGWQWKNPGHCTWSKLEQTPATFPALLDLLDNPDEEVPE